MWLQTGSLYLTGSSSGASTLGLTSCTATNNVANMGGFAALNGYAIVTVAQTSFSKNSVSGAGGGCFSLQAGDVINIQAGTTFTNNQGNNNANGGELSLLTCPRQHTRCCSQVFSC